MTQKIIDMCSWSKNIGFNMLWQWEPSLLRSLLPSYDGSGRKAPFTIKLEKLNRFALEKII